ncbi:MAG: 5'/3'-nucleotidase SurE [Bacteriovoracaceae bacterium]
MMILLSNDDGVHAPGIRSLYEHLKDDFDVYVIAPLEERSTTGHTLSLTNPLRLVEVEEKVFGCSGYPADCVLMGLGHVLPKRPDLVISGINYGSNLGQDVYYSGTAAAAREGVFHGVPGISVSTTTNIGQSKRKEPWFETAAEFVHKLVKNEVHTHIDELTMLNINVPNMPTAELAPTKVCPLGFRNYSEAIEKRMDFRDRPYYWIVGDYLGSGPQEETDCHVLENNSISFTELNLLHKQSDSTKKWRKFISNL